MSTISLRLPESLHKKARELSKTDKVSINQFIASALAEKISAFFSEDYFAKRSKAANKKSFAKALAKIKKTEPEDFDKL